MTNRPTRQKQFSTQCCIAEPPQLQTPLAASRAAPLLTACKVGCRSDKNQRITDLQQM